MADPDIPFRGAHLSTNETECQGNCQSFGGRKLIYNKIITRIIWEGGGGGGGGPPRSASGLTFVRS